MTHISCRSVCRRLTVLFVSSLWLSATIACEQVAAITANGDDAWVRPVDGEVITTYRNDNDRPYSAGMHRGIDIAAQVGARVVAARGGTVRYAGHLGSSGLVVSISDSNGDYVQSYLHLADAEVSRGETVKAGQTIGQVGTSGRRSDERPHLHFGIRDAADEHFYYDPSDLLSPKTPEDRYPVPSVTSRSPLPSPQPVPVVSAPRSVRSLAVEAIPKLKPVPHPALSAQPTQVRSSAAPYRVKVTETEYQHKPRVATGTNPAAGTRYRNAPVRSEGQPEPVSRDPQRSADRLTTVPSRSGPVSHAPGQSMSHIFSFIGAVLLLTAGLGRPLIRALRSAYYFLPRASAAFLAALRIALTLAARALEALGVRTLNLLQRFRFFPLLPRPSATRELFLLITARTDQR